MPSAPLGCEGNNNLVRLDSECGHREQVIHGSLAISVVDGVCVERAPTAFLLLSPFFHGLP